MQLSAFIAMDSGSRNVQLIKFQVFKHTNHFECREDYDFSYGLLGDLIQHEAKITI